MSEMFREIWKWNRDTEMSLIYDCLRTHRFIAIDTEFPGCLKQTPKDATDDERYEDMCFSVNKTKLIQLGLTLFDSEGIIGGTWEINFCDFVEMEDDRNEKSIDFLKKNGLNIKKIREDGISIDRFFADLIWILKQMNNTITWVTFHGLYDIAYLLKYVTVTLPRTSEEFAKAMGEIFSSVYDLKIMADRYEGLSSRLGLQGLAHELGVNRVGVAHHAGSDSELTARVFTKMAQICDNIKASEGFVYGLGCRIVSYRLKQEIMMMHRMHIHRVMMTRCYGPRLLPRPIPPQALMHPQLRPMFVPGFPQSGGFVLLPRVSMF